MAKVRHYIFSARTTEDGLKTLNGLKAKLGVGWDDLIIDAVNAHYQVSVPKPPRAERPEKVLRPKAEKKAKAGKKAEAGG